MKYQSSPSSLYYVPSNGNQKGGVPRYYLVGEFPGTRQVFRCECPAGQNARRCWHVGSVEAGMVKAARLKAAAPAAPAAAPAPEPKPVLAPERDRGFIPVPWFKNPHDEPHRRNLDIVHSLYA